MRSAIIIPARYGSTRFPGKPLAEIAGMTMLERVIKTAKMVDDGAHTIIVATEDERILNHAQELGAHGVLTSDNCETGSDRVLEAAQTLEDKPDFVINLQGDAPFTDPKILSQIFQTFRDNPALEVITPIHRLSWDDLDRLRENKKQTPFSGTTVTINASGRALWFSKNIIPALRKEEKLRAQNTLSPIHQHMGIYGYRTDALEKFCALPLGTYEQLEGLEQLRMLENDITIQTVEIALDNGAIQSGIDSPEDITRAEKFIATHGDPHK